MMTDDYRSLTNVQRANMLHRIHWSEWRESHNTHKNTLKRICNKSNRIKIQTPFILTEIIIIMKMIKPFMKMVTVVIRAATN